MKNSDRPLPLAVRILVAVVSAALLFPLVLAVVAIVHGAAIPVMRWLSPLLAVAIGVVVFRARGRYAAIWLILWVIAVAQYALEFLRG
jgi:hypothetical protein